MGIINYISETKQEMKHVTWPTTYQTVIFTLLVIVLSLLVAAYLGLLDAIFATIVTKFFA